MTDLDTELAALARSLENIVTKGDGPAAQIANIALRAGGARILAEMNENATPQLRLAIQNFAENGGGLDIIAQSIRALWPDGGGDSLSDSEIGELASYIVENYQS